MLLVLTIEHKLCLLLFPGKEFRIISIIIPSRQVNHARDMVATQHTFPPHVWRKTGRPKWSGPDRLSDDRTGCKLGVYAIKDMHQLAAKAPWGGVRQCNPKPFHITIPHILLFFSNLTHQFHPTTTHQNQNTHDDNNHQTNHRLRRNWYPCPSSLLHDTSHLINLTQHRPPRLLRRALPPPKPGFPRPRHNPHSGVNQSARTRLPRGRNREGRWLQPRGITLSICW